MREFDIGRPWTVLAASPDAAGPDGAAVEATAARELARWLEELRASAGSEETVPVLQANAPAPDENVPIIVLNAGDSSDGFSWRAGADRVEIYGDSPKGLLSGVYDFLRALGLSWERPGAPPRFPYIPDGKLTLAKTGAYEKDEGHRKTLAPDRAAAGTELVEFIAWAARSKARAVYIPRLRRNAGDAATDSARAYGIDIETDAPAPRTLVPRRLLLIRPELFPLIGGRRRLRGAFCPTSPEALRIAEERAERYFGSRPAADCYRFEPGLDEAPWCACPSCRAFSPAEQKLMAANAVAAALERAQERAQKRTQRQTRPGARLLVEIGDSYAPETSAIEPRNNIVIVRCRRAEGNAAALSPSSKETI